MLELVNCQGNSSDGGKMMEPLYVLDLLRIWKKIDPDKSFTNVVMFYGASNVQLGGYILEINYSKLTAIHGVEHTISIFFNDV